MLSRLRWVAIIATLMFAASVVYVLAGSVLHAIYIAVCAVFLLLVDLTRS